MKIFCSGIGGIGLSAYASHMRERGHAVSGSDAADSALLDVLRAEGMNISLTQDGSSIPEDTELFVYSEAIPEDSPERAEAKRRGIHRISYFQAIGELTSGTNLIAVCGTHGKSSTTAMAASLLIEAGLDPNIIVGTKLPSLDGRNWRRGLSDLWIVEACEYRRSFLHLKPNTILLTNADGDHFDYFNDANDYRNAFIEFVSGLPETGTIIVHGNDVQSMTIVREARRNFLDADLFEMPVLSVPGEHMKKNAQLVLALSDQMKIPETITARALKSYAGSWRRMEERGTVQGITIVDDYAHHPLEIGATLAAMKSAYPKRRIVAVFQPHTHSRTLKLWNDFTQAFSDADAVMLLDVYGARAEKDTKKADVASLAADISKYSGKNCDVLGSISNAAQLLCADAAKSGDVIVVMGAGDSTKLSDLLMKNL